MQSNDQFIHTLTNLTKDERRKISADSAKFIAAEDQTDRIHAAFPDLRDRVRVLSYNLHFDASASGRSFWTNLGKKYDMECEITTPNDGPQTLLLAVNYWSVEGMYLTGSIWEDWMTVKAAYRGSKAEFQTDSYGDPGRDWGNVAHGNLNSLFRRVAVDAGLLGGDRAEDSVLKKMVQAFLGDEVCTRKVYRPKGCSPGEDSYGRSPKVLNIILKEMAWEYDSREMI